MSVTVGIISKPEHAKSHEQVLRSHGYEVELLGGNPSSVPDRVDILVVRSVSSSHQGFDLANEERRQKRRPVIYADSVSKMRKQVDRAAKDIARVQKVESKPPASGVLALALPDNNGSTPSPLSGLTEVTFRKGRLLSYNAANLILARGGVLGRDLFGITIPKIVEFLSANGMTSNDHSKKSELAALYGEFLGTTRSQSQFSRLFDKLQENVDKGIIDPKPLETFFWYKNKRGFAIRTRVFHKNKLSDSQTRLIASFLNRKLEKPSDAHDMVPILGRVQMAAQKLEKPTPTKVVEKQGVWKRLSTAEIARRIAPHVDKLGKIPDRELVDLIGVRREVIGMYRRKHNIEAFGPGGRREWKKKEKPAAVASKPVVAPAPVAASAVRPPPTPASARSTRPTDDLREIVMMLKEQMEVLGYSELHIVDGKVTGVKKVIVTESIVMG